MFILDATGRVLVSKTMIGCPRLIPDIARAKAGAAIGTHASSRVLKDKYVPDRTPQLENYHPEQLNQRFAGGYSGSRQQIAQSVAQVTPAPARAFAISPLACRERDPPHGSGDPVCEKVRGGGCTRTLGSEIALSRAYFTIFVFRNPSVCLHPFAAALNRNVRGATARIHQGEAWRTGLLWPPAKRPLADGASSIPTALTGATATSSSYHTLRLTAVRWLAGVRVRSRPNHGAAPKAAAK